ncbi:MAG: tripartite tricarboxylate transporter substrate binding protein [Candidatus Tectomicrobia bacterium]|nr:tripartite tricarboxylate transporter substrate binding protein [Candidatus Tectomicrobia bacterium]
MHRPERMAGVVWALFLAALLFSFGAAQAAWQPTKPVEFVIPAGTGGGADLMARFMSALIQKNKLAPVNFLVVNKSGGAGAEGFLHVKSQKGNPHVIIITLSNLFTTPIATGVPFNWRDLTPVSMMALDYFVLWVNAESPYKTATEYINAVKAKASGFKMGGTGAKQEDQIITVQMEQNFGLKFIYVPFKGGGAVCANLVGKHVDSTVNNPSECVGHWKAKRVRPLAAIDHDRIKLPQWDTIPTMKEATGKDMAYNMLRGIFAAPGIPKEAQEYYVGLMKRISETADWKKYITDSALKGQFMTGPEYVKWLGEAEALHRDLMTKAGLIKK